MHKDKLMPAGLACLLAATIAISGCTRAEKGPVSAVPQEIETRTSAVRETAPGTMMTNEEIDQCHRMMMQNLGKGGEYDQRYLDMMMRMDQGAINMAKNASQNATHPELKQMAQQISTSRQQEMEQMRTWRDQWYGKTSTTPTTTTPTTTQTP
ncbi:MAG TPA: DUF305 domain-containing protein [Coleofasciculaceae cyanobacterium]|jgi:uncharacterized protein (DUF305 family)